MAAEGHAWFLRRFDIDHGLRFIGVLEDMPFLRILGAGEHEIAEAAKILRRFNDQDLTLVDAVGLHLITSRSTSMCWSTDRQLGLTGAPLVIHG